MKMIKHGIFLSLMVVSLSPLAFSLSCERPPAPEVCQSFSPSCLAVDVKKCTAAGGRHIRNGNFCNHCDICGKDVGAGETCHYSTMSAEGVYWTGVCLPPYICSRNHEGVCVRPEECEYETTTQPTSHSDRNE